MDKSLTPLISLTQISKRFSGHHSTIEILDRADLTVCKGESIAITGASGIGKSTLLNIIGTLDKPDSGKIFFRDRDLLALKDDQLAMFRNSKIGFVFQFHYLLQGFSAVENVMMPGLIAGRVKKRVEKEALNMLDRVGLSTRSSHRVEDLSGGEQQRVALARALVMGPEILLADEPTGNLDRKNSDSVHLLIQELNKELGMTVIVVTHNNELAQMMDTNLTLINGTVKPAESTGVSKKTS
ncbi:MAG: ABC transporter ATP-binding protein [Desulfobacterales bacterium]|nr:ABC transporter ATP-binding protein [Desulfobacterales bacterium]